MLLTALGAMFPDPAGPASNAQSYVSFPRLLSGSQPYIWRIRFLVKAVPCELYIHLHNDEIKCKLAITVTIFLSTLFRATKKQPVLVTLLTAQYPGLPPHLPRLAVFHSKNSAVAFSVATLASKKTRWSYSRFNFARYFNTGLVLKQCFQTKLKKCKLW